MLSGSLAEVEGEKGRVLVELQRVQREVEVVTQRNAEMAQVRDSQGDEMEELKLKNTHLIQKVHLYTNNYVYVNNVCIVCLHSCVYKIHNESIVNITSTIIMYVREFCWMVITRVYTVIM